eukprot:2824130-Amphidinium_carterae.1
MMCLPTHFIPSTDKKNSTSGTGVPSCHDLQAQCAPNFNGRSHNYFVLCAIVCNGSKPLPTHFKRMVSYQLCHSPCAATITALQCNYAQLRHSSKHLNAKQPAPHF